MPILRNNPITKLLRALYNIFIKDSSRPEDWDWFKDEPQNKIITPRPQYTENKNSSDFNWDRGSNRDYCSDVKQNMQKDEKGDVSLLVSTTEKVMPVANDASSLEQGESESTRTLQDATPMESESNSDEKTLDLSPVLKNEIQSLGIYDFLMQKRLLEGAEVESHSFLYDGNCYNTDNPFSVKIENGKLNVFDGSPCSVEGFFHGLSKGNTEVFNEGSDNERHFQENVGKGLSR